MLNLYHIVHLRLGVPAETDTRTRCAGLPLGSTSVYKVYNNGYENSDHEKDSDYGQRYHTTPEVATAATSAAAVAFVAAAFAAAPVATWHFFFNNDWWWNGLMYDCYLLVLVICHLGHLQLYRPTQTQAERYNQSINLFLLNVTNIHRTV